MEKFEYAVVELEATARADQSRLNDLGKEGWELVTIIQAPITLPVRPTVLGYLKRPKEE